MADVLGMTPLTGLRDTVSSAVRLIIDSQNSAGGWRYTPHVEDADVSVTACQIMALRAARNAGFFIPPDVISRALEYVLQCRNEDGGFRYMLTDGASDFPRSAAALVSLHAAGDYTSEAVVQARNYLMGFLPEIDEAAAAARPGAVPYRQYFYYGHYYAAQAMWQAGDTIWSPWFQSAQRILLKMQAEDGSWASEFGSVYGTAMATIVLQIPNNVLPIIQR
jgi:hypothetical protein